MHQTHSDENPIKSTLRISISVRLAWLPNCQPCLLHGKLKVRIPCQKKISKANSCSKRDQIVFLFRSKTEISNLVAKPSRKWEQPVLPQSCQCVCTRALIGHNYARSARCNYCPKNSSPKNLPKWKNRCQWRNRAKQSKKTSSQSKVEIFDRFAFAARFVFRFSRFVRAISRARTYNRSSSDRSIAQSIKVDRETFLPQAQSIYDQLRPARHSSLSIPRGQLRNAADAAWAHRAICCGYLDERRI